MEYGFGAAGFLSGSDQSAIGAVAKQEVQRADQDGFTGAGLARDNVQPGFEIDPDIFHERNVLNAQSCEHERKLTPLFKYQFSETATSTTQQFSFWRQGRRQGPSPRVWGKPGAYLLPRRHQRTIPTRVGKTDIHSQPPAEHRGPSPRVWGKLSGAAKWNDSKRTIPTRVGKTIRRSNPRN